MSDFYDLIRDQDLYYEDNDNLYDTEVDLENLERNIKTNCRAGNPIKIGNCPNTPYDIFDAIEIEDIEWESPSYVGEHVVQYSTYIKQLGWNVVSIVIVIAMGLLLWKVATSMLTGYRWCKYNPLKSKRRASYGHVAAHLEGIHDAIDIIKNDDYVTQLWIDPDIILCRLSEIIDRLIVLVKEQAKGQSLGATQTDGLMRCLDACGGLFEVLLPDGSTNGDSGGLKSLFKEVDVEEQLLLVDVIGRLEKDRDRLNICRRSCNLFRNTKERVTGNLSRDTALRNVRTLLTLFVDLL